MSYDYAIAPGLSPFDYSGLERVVKGPTAVRLLPRILRRASVDSLSPSKPAERALDEAVVSRVFEEVFEEIAARAVWVEASDARVPKRPPPIAVLSDIYVEPPADAERVAREAEYRVWAGADAVVLSFDYSLGSRDVLRVVERVLDSIEAPVAVDSPSLDAVAEAVEAGASVAMSFTADTLLEAVARLGDEVFYVVIPRELGDWRLRARELARVCELASKASLSVILDPVMQPPLSPGSLESLLAARALSSEEACRDYPVMLGLNNAIELADVDTHASTAILTFLAAEAGASLVMVGEESYKARASTLEAKIAAAMASAALYLRSPPKDMPLNLLPYKSKSPPEGVSYLGSGVFEKAGGRVDCREESVGELCKYWSVRESWRRLLGKYSTLFRLKREQRG
ncbi:MAG: hypothetical protein QXJ91_05910 [Acidilobaceae archaeon]